jgi:biopolymer transport protein ExbB
MFLGLSPFTKAFTRSQALTLALLVGVAAIAFTSVLAPTAVQAADEEEAKTDDGEAAPAASESFLTWMIRASGIFGFVLLLLSFIMVALIMMNVLQVRRDNLLPPAFIEGFEQRLAQKDYQGAYEVAKADDSFVARVLAAGLSKLNRGYDEAIEGMQEVGEDENMALEHRLSYLALIGTVAPMLGLMGTVYGMIESFRVIATSEGQPKPSKLADGISTALFTTIEGLAVAIPAMVFYSLLRNRVARFVLEVGMISEGLMSRFSTMGKKPAGGGAPQAAPAAKQE